MIAEFVQHRMQILQLNSLITVVLMVYDTIRVSISIDKYQIIYMIENISYSFIQRSKQRAARFSKIPKHRYLV